MAPSSCVPPPPSCAFSDLLPGDWVDRQLPSWARPFARLMRLDRPIGTWLLLWPCWWGLALASPDWAFDFWDMTLFAVGAIVMRGAGCVVNDLYDRKIDAQVERTRTRPLASGVLGVRQALAFLVLLLAIGLGVLVQFNGLTICLGLSSMGLVLTYPLAKRVTWWPQAVLGLAFNWGALIGWTAVRERLELPALVLYAAGIFWTLGYDTIYACQDRADDILIGVKSSARRLGGHVLEGVIVFFAVSLGLLTWAGRLAGLGMSFYIALIGAASHAVWQLATWQPDDPASSLRRFRGNRDFGALVFLAIWIGKAL